MKSCASVPPASDWIVTTASPASYSPEKSASSWRRSSSASHWLERGLDLGGHVAVHGEELPRVVVLAAQALVALEPLDDRACSVEIRGGALLVVPEAGLAHLRLELGGALASASGSKVITDPVELGPDLLQALVE